MSQPSSLFYNSQDAAVEERVDQIKQYLLRGEYLPPSSAFDLGLLYASSRRDLKASPKEVLTDDGKPSPPSPPRPQLSQSTQAQLDRADRRIMAIYTKKLHAAFILYRQFVENTPPGSPLTTRSEAKKYASLYRVLLHELVRGNLVEGLREGYIHMLRQFHNSVVRNDVLNFLLLKLSDRRERQYLENLDPYAIYDAESETSSSQSQSNSSQKDPEHDDEPSSSQSSSSQDLWTSGGGDDPKSDDSDSYFKSAYNSTHQDEEAAELPPSMVRSADIVDLELDEEDEENGIIAALEAELVWYFEQNAAFPDECGSSGTSEVHTPRSGCDSLPSEPPYSRETSMAADSPLPADTFHDRVTTEPDNSHSGLGFVDEAEWEGNSEDGSGYYVGDDGRMYSVFGSQLPPEY